MNQADQWVAEILARQDGVITREQALRAGMTLGRLRRLRETQRWLPVHPGVYRSADHPFGITSRVRAVALWGGDSSYLCGLSAAWWWGMTPVEPRVVGLLIPRHANKRARPGMRIIRRDVAYQDRAWHRTVRVTGPALSALAASVELGADGPALLDRALQTRVGFADVRAAYYRSLGSRGSERAGELIRAAADGSSAASERKFVGLLRAAGITGWQLNYPWNAADPRTTIDIAFVSARLAVEIDGWAWHHSPGRFQRDRTKQNDLIRAGWTILRFTWSDLTDRPTDVIRQVRELLACH